MVNTEDTGKEEDAPINLDETQVVVALPETPTLTPEPESIPNWIK
jgi:hypothetical protein